MARIVLDTDVASLSYKGRLPMPLAARLVGHEVCVTFVTIGELARWAEKRLIAGLPLATRNLKDFTDFAEHDGLRMIGVS